MGINWEEEGDEWSPDGLEGSCGGGFEVIVTREGSRGGSFFWIGLEFCFLGTPFWNSKKLELQKTFGTPKLRKMSSNFPEMCSPLCSSSVLTTVILDLVESVSNFGNGLDVG